ncbi:hypothetical protein GCM10007939_13730 [Amylibacter marinus]|uniref:Uncharacterized protein n=1 Tax=Amylibacter marinus TaxID=1475483 RepID=A0ABQ5VUH0_9RHOB|nr:hypothetical protein [Amylibacter marinus]GLQ35090.1 hypothetical protein GCM10007939_13730 [Amylibacter marinus]
MQHTPWKKSRSYGDNYGGATRHREEDNIHARYHSFDRPSAYDDLPIMRVDNPSRDWFHPLDADQVRYALKALPNHDNDVTHVWLRRGQHPDWGVATGIWGSGVSLITLYAAPRNLIRDHGAQKPQQSCQRIYQRYGAKLRRVGNRWQAVWTLPELRRFYLYEGLYDCAADHSAYVWRDGRCNTQKARDQRMEDWLYRRKVLAHSVYRDLFE